MNAEEGVSLAKMAVTVLLVVLIIGAVVAIVYAAYSWFNSGTAKLGDQVVSIDKSAFSQYDDAIVTGNDVLSAMKTYRESEIAIYVANLKTQGTSNYNKTGGYTTPETTKAYNYCGLTVDAYGNTTSIASPYSLNVTYGNSTNNKTLKNCYFVPGLAFDASTNVLARNTNFSPTTTNSNKDCYVKTTAKWYANLVYDESTGDICGILFRQMN